MRTVDTAENDGPRSTALRTHWLSALSCEFVSARYAEPDLSTLNLRIMCSLRLVTVWKRFTERASVDRIGQIGKGAGNSSVSKFLLPF